jgi:hypothetical protein
LPADDVRIEGRSTEYVRFSDDGGERREFHFCPECGSTVYYRVGEAPDMIAVPIGAFADPGFPPPAISVYESRRHPWVAVSAAVEQRYD